MCTWKPKEGAVWSFLPLSTLFFEAGSLDEIGANLAGPSLRDPSLLLPPTVLKYQAAQPSLAFMWVLGSELCSSCLCRKYSPSLGYLVSPD